MVERIGYPESILNDTELDGMYKEVSLHLCQRNLCFCAGLFTKKFNDVRCDNPLCQSSMTHVDFDFTFELKTVLQLVSLYKQPYRLPLILESF